MVLYWRILDRETVTMLHGINGSTCVRFSVRDYGETFRSKTEYVQGRCIISSDRDGEPTLPLLVSDIQWCLYTAVGRLCNMRLWLQLFTFQTETAEYMGAARPNTDTILDSTPALKVGCRRSPNRAPRHPAAGRFKILIFLSIYVYYSFKRQLRSDKQLLISIIDKHQQMHFFTFNTILV